MGSSIRELGAISVWTMVSILWLANGAQAQDTPDYFRQNCMNCHTIGGGALTGPDLKDVTKRKDRDWLMGFMMNPRQYIDSGDPYALKLLAEARNVPMPILPGLTRERAGKLLDLIDAESALESSQFKGLQVSTRPFTDDDRKIGRQLFLGVVRLQAGGASCLSCHTTHGVAALGGGRLGPDLTNVYERLKGRKALSAWLAAPGTETMQPIFKNHPLTPDEILALTAFFESTASESPLPPTASRVTFLLLGLAGAGALIVAFDAIWRSRFHAVRRPLVGAMPRGQS